MPVIINEIEVLEPPVPAASGPAQTTPAPAAPAITADRILLLLRDASERQRRLMAD